MLMQLKLSLGLSEYCSPVFLFQACIKIRDVPDSNFFKSGLNRIVPDIKRTIRPEPEPYLDTCCIIANFLVYFVVRIKMYYFLCLFSALCAHTLHTNICKTVGLHDSLGL